MKSLQHRLKANPTIKIPKTIKVNEYYMINVFLTYVAHAFFYKQHFYQQLQYEIGKN